MAQLAVKNLTKVFSPDITAVDRLSLSAAVGELLVVVGPSGCGKTTLLRMIAGLERPSSGTVEIAGRDVTSIAPRERGVAMVMQRAALYPHWRVRHNIGFGLRMRNVRGDERVRRISNAARLLCIEGLLDRRPDELSGGQQRRVALARALVAEAPCLLLDEPLSHLDTKARRQLREEISRIQKQLGTTTIYVTHDHEEALAVGDRLAVMAAGAVQQCDAPQVVYGQPTNRFVAEFMSAGPMNFVSGHLARNHGRPRFECDLGSLALPARIAQQFDKQQADRFVLGVRSESIRQATGQPADQNAMRFSATTTDSRRIGAVNEIRLTMGPETQFIARLNQTRTGAASSVNDYVVDWANVHFFEPGSFGRNLLYTRG